MINENYDNQTKIHIDTAINNRCKYNSMMQVDVATIMHEGGVRELTIFTANEWLHISSRKTLH